MGPGVAWEQATEAETAALVGWLRTARNPQRQRKAGGYRLGSVNPKTGKPMLRAGYAPTTIDHDLSAVYGFYSFHLHFGRGPAGQPGASAAGPAGRRSPTASPIETRAVHRRARLRPKVPARLPRASPERQWDELFAQMQCARDRALLSCYVSSGARASELLGVGLGDIDWAKGRCG